MPVATDELDDFLSKVDEVSQKIEDIKSGKTLIELDNEAEEDLKYKMDVELMNFRDKMESKEEETVEVRQKRREEAIGTFF